MKENNELVLKPIGYIRNRFTNKLGIPRQSGMVDNPSRIVLLPEYRNTEIYRGLDGYDYVWLIWGFSANRERPWAATVKPPRLGGKIRMGVFATRSPYRPNPIGLSSVRITALEQEEDGPVLYVSGADLLDGTPIYDIKPYLPYADAHEHARGGFSDDLRESTAMKPVYYNMAVFEELGIEDSMRQEILDLIALDPRPGYDTDNEDRDFKMYYGDYDIHFTPHDDGFLILRVIRK